MLSCTASTPDLAQSIGFVRGTLDVPAGVQAAIEQRSHAHGMRSLGIWAQVPHYVAGMPYPKASIALIEGFNAVSGLHLDFGALPQEADEAEARMTRSLPATKSTPPWCGRSNSNSTRTHRSDPCPRATTLPPSSRPSCATSRPAVGSDDLAPSLNHSPSGSRVQRPDGAGVSPNIT